MDALNLLEKRIDTLTRILGPIPDTQSSHSDGSKTFNQNENVVDSLLSANSLLDDTIGEREHIKNSLKRAPELEKYLDPNFLEENQNVRSKEVYLNAVAPDLQHQFEQLDRIKELEPTLGAEYFRSIPSDRTEKLIQISDDNTEFSQQSELIEEGLILAMKRYGELQAGLLESLASMNKRLEAVEEKVRRKKREEHEKDLPFPDEK